jgi:hypothetical protein
MLSTSARTLGAVPHLYPADGVGTHEALASPEQTSLSGRCADNSAGHVKNRTLERTTALAS